MRYLLPPSRVTHLHFKKRLSFLRMTAFFSLSGYLALTPILLSPLTPPLGVIAAATKFLSSSACCRNTCNHNKVGTIFFVQPDRRSPSQGSKGPKKPFDPINRHFGSNRRPPQKSITIVRFFCNGYRNKLPI